jgi:MFS family permease
MSSINSIPEYQEYYQLGPKGAANTGLVFSIFQIAQMVGALFIWLCDWWGRRWTIVLGCAGVVVSAVITAVAPNLSTFIGGRFLLSFFSTLATAAAPLLLVEIAPPLNRGTVAGVYNTLYYIGSIIATFSMFHAPVLLRSLHDLAIYGCNLHVEGNLKWRLPLWLQMLCPGLVCLGSWFLPESPRWLVAKGRVEEARAFIVQHHANGDASHPIVELEMHEIGQSLEEGNISSVRRFFDLRTLVKSRARLYRLMLALTMAWFGQFSGNNIASYYLPFMLTNVGITELNLVLLLNAMYAVTGWIAATIGGMMTSCLHIA